MKENVIFDRRASFVKIVLAGAIVIGGGVAIANHEQERDHQLQLVRNELEQIRLDQAKQWGLLCRDDAVVDNAVQGDTNITLDTNGLANCKDGATQFRDKFNQEPK